MKSDGMSDIELIRSCLQGDAEAYRGIMEKYRHGAFALALNVLRNREDAEDVCQDSFLKAFHNLDKFDVRGSFKNWFYTLLYRSCIDSIRKKRRFFDFFSKFKAEPLASSFQRAPNPKTEEKIEARFLQRLSPNERLSVYLWANEGYTSEEIASVLRCSPSTARVNLFKARKKIKAMLEEKNGEMQVI